MILAAIIALAAGGVILIMLGIAFVQPRDHDVVTPRPYQRVERQTTIRRDGVTPALRSSEARGPFERTRAPRRRAFATRKPRKRSPDWRRELHRWAVDGRTSDAKIFAGAIACSAAAGLLIAYLS